MKSILYFLGGVVITFIVVMIIGFNAIEEDCNKAGGILAGTTCVNPGAVIEVN